MDDADAFSELYRRDGEAVLVFLTRRTLDVEVALELTAETFAIALNSWRKLSGLADEQRRAWLFTVAARRFGRYLRRTSVERRLVARLGIDVPQAGAEDIALIEQRAGLGELRTALGHNFEFVRRAVAKELVKKTAWQNAAVGVLMFIPGADMPIMTLNQGKMLLQIAATYGQSLDTDRVKELGAVVAGGFLFRTFARELVGLIPGFGWAVKGGIAYSGTVAMGAAAISYFEEGTDLSGVVKALTERAGEAASRVVSRVGERGGMLHADLEGARPSKDAVPAPRAAALPGSEEPQQTALVDVPECTPTLPVADEPETPLEVGKPRP